MSALPTEALTPVERLQASRAQIRAVLLEAKYPTGSTLHTLLKPSVKPSVKHLVKPLAIPLIAWASLALTLWLRGRSHPD
jgi:hypothetical protein